MEEIRSEQKMMQNSGKRRSNVSDLLAYFQNDFTYLELKSVIDSLHEEECRIMYLKCGVMLDGKNTGVLTKEEQNRIHTSIMLKIKHRLNKMYPGRSKKVEQFILTQNKRFQISEDMQVISIRTNHSVKNLLAYFDDSYSYQELKGIVDTLSDEEKNIVYTNCGKLLDGNSQGSLTKEQQLQMSHSCIPKIKRRLYKLYPGRNKKVDSFVLERRHNAYQYRVATGKNKKNLLGGRNLLAYFDNKYSFEELKYAVDSLEVQDRKDMYIICGKFLDGNVLEEVSKELRRKFSTSYILKLKRILSDSYPGKNKELDEFVQNFRKRNAAQKRKKTISLVTPIVDLESTPIGVDYGSISISIVRDLLVNIEPSYNINQLEMLLFRQDYQAFGMLLQLEEIKALVNMSFTVEEAIVIFLLYLIGEGNVYTICDVAFLLKISVEDIKRIAKEGISKYQCLRNQTEVQMKKI